MRGKLFRSQDHKKARILNPLKYVYIESTLNGTDVMIYASSLRTVSELCFCCCLFVCFSFSFEPEKMFLSFYFQSFKILAVFWCIFP